MMAIKRYLLLYVLFCLVLIIPARTQTATDPDQKLEWWGNIDGYLNQQAKTSLQWVEQTLKKEPPSLNDPITRKMAYSVIDLVLHEEKAPLQPAVQDFFHHRIAEAIQEMQSEHVDQGAIIWKLYNHAFIVKTASVTLGFDIQRGAVGIPAFMLSDTLMQQLADIIDVLFISHNHPDHFDLPFTEMVLARHKPVITPPDLWTDQPIYNQLIHLDKNAEKSQSVPLPLKNSNLTVIVYPGHQGDDLLNNVYLVSTTEDMTFVHTGDQSNSKDFSWLDRVGDHHRVDVLMINSWSVYPEQRYAKGYRPRLILPGHENELGHTIDHREPYWLNDNRLGDKIEFPWIQLVWGEHYHYMPKTY